MNTYINKETAEKIKQAAKLEDVVLDHILNLKKKGSARVGECPSCGANKFNYVPSKDLYTCFNCNEGGKSAIQFLTSMKGMSYPDALRSLADRYNILIEEETKKPLNINHSESFRNRQLLASGIPDAEQKYTFTEGATTYEYDRYQSATLDEFWNLLPEGDDMILHYLNLDGNPKMFQTKTNKSRRVIRVRWQNPDHHINKDGSKGKYKSPAGSGSHLWYPQAFLAWYKQKKQIETLVIPEGEKKADKLCLEGIPSVGVMGIHNFGIKGDMANELRLIIKRCQVKNVVFLLDSDWQDISIKQGKNVNQRPYSFYSAVKKFHDYFYAYNNEGIHLNIYFAYGKDKALKGIDDQLVRGEDIDELKKEFKELLIDREGEGKQINMRKITGISEYKLREYFLLHSDQAFLNHYKNQLKELPEFVMNRIRRKWNEETKAFELVQAIQPHQEFWEEYEDRSGNSHVVFRYVPMIEFLKSKGYGLLKDKGGNYRLIHENCTTVTEVTPHDIQTFCRHFISAINRKDVLEMLFRADDQYMSETKLRKMQFKNPSFIQPDKNTQYLFFQKTYWKITAEGIEEFALDDLPGYVWKDQIIDFEPKKLNPMLKIEREDEYWNIEETKAFQESDIAQFYARTSNFHWKKDERLGVNPQGDKCWVDREEPESITREDAIKQNDNLVSKMLAAGYVLHQYKDWGLMKAIVPMDGTETEVGTSNGGTGKSLWSKQFNHIVPSVIIDGKKKNIEDDNFLYSKVDERTQVIVFDDVRINFNFEMLFSHITTSIEVNRKGKDSYSLDPPKFIIPTNHALKGSGASFSRRQYVISFSDYYNEYRRVDQDFGHQFFTEWEWDQWNYFYNWIALCIQQYLKHRLDFEINQDDIKKRKLRQAIGENFLDWADAQFGINGTLLNKKVEKHYCRNKFLDIYPKEQKYINARNFTKKMKLYAEYAQLDYNASNKGGRIKSNGNEYYLISDDRFNAEDKTLIHSDFDVKQEQIKEFI